MKNLNGLRAKAFIAPKTLAELFAGRARISEGDGSSYLNTLASLVLDLLDSGFRVRFLGVGYFERIKTKATKRASAMVPDRVVEIPSRRKIVFRESRKTLAQRAAARNPRGKPKSLLQGRV